MSNRVSHAENGRRRAGFNSIDECKTNKKEIAISFKRANHSLSIDKKNLKIDSST